MSTVCKLDPMVRFNRSHRAEFVKSLGRVIKQLQSIGAYDQAAKARTMFFTLNRIANDGTVTGEAKDRIFHSIGRALANFAQPTGETHAS